MSNQIKIQELKRDIIRYTKACRSEYPRPIDYMNLIDAQHELRSLELPDIPMQETKRKTQPISWFKSIKYWNKVIPEQVNHV